MEFQVDKVISCVIKDRKTEETLLEWTMEKCPLFEFCNCKTAVCRTMLPDETCYWYRYFEKLIMEKNK